LGAESNWLKVKKDGNGGESASKPNYLWTLSSPTKA